MKKVIKWTILALIVIIIGVLVWHFATPYQKSESINAIAAKPVFIIEIDNSFKSWDKLTSSTEWTHLKHHRLFAELSEGMELVDSIVRKNENLARFIGSHNLTISTHLVGPGTYDFLYIMDLRRASKFVAMRDFFNKTLHLDLNLPRYKYHGQTIYTITVKDQVFYVYFAGNLMVASMRKSLTESSADGLKNPVIATDLNFLGIKERLGNDGLFRFYINYSQLDDYLNPLLQSTDENIKQLSRNLFYTGLSFTIDNELIKCEGYTNYNDTLVSALRAMSHSGTGKSEVAEVLPLQFASSVSIGFDRFTEYFDNITNNLKEIPKTYTENQQTIKQIENFLNISIRDNFMSWISDEAAMVQFPPFGLGKNNEFAVFLKARNIHDAQKNLQFIADQVRKRSPVKFSKVNYRGYDINYMSVKGLFKVILGKYFQKLEKPYYIVLNDYVVLSNHPQTLKIVIDAVENKTITDDAPGYRKFIRCFDRESNVFLQVHTPTLLESLRSSLNAATWRDLNADRKYIVSFPYIGFQLEKDGPLFSTKLCVLFDSTARDDFRVPEPESEETVEANSDSTQTTEPEKPTVEELMKNIDNYIPDDLTASKYTESYKNGNLKVEFELKDGFRNGDYIEYYENGTVKIKGQYKSDQRTGTWKVYDRDGNLLDKVKY